MKLKVSRNVKHSMEPVRFAYGFAQARARSWGKKLNGVGVRVTSMTQYDRGYSGRAFLRSERILVRLAPVLAPHEHRYPKFQDMPTFRMWGQHESIVYIAAHEFGHIIGYGSGKAAEIACCKFGYEAVQAWRDRQYEHPACII